MEQTFMSSQQLETRCDLFDDMTAHVEANKKISAIISELFPRGKKPNFSFVFKSLSFFEVSKPIIANVTS